MTKSEIDAEGLRYPMAKRSAYWTFDEKSAVTEGNLYYFAPLDRAPPPYLTQRRVEAIIDIAADGTLAGVELIDNMPPPPRSVTSPSEHEAMIAPEIEAEGLALLQMVRDLIQEAKGFEGGQGGPITDHLDAAEGWLDRLEAYLATTRTSEAADPVAPRSEAELEALPAHPLAKWKGGLEMGLHRVHWKGGGTSLAAVGQMSDGRKWFAPCNWVSPSQNPEADFWLEIDHTELLHSHPETHPSPVSDEVAEAEVLAATLAAEKTMPVRFQGEIGVGEFDRMIRAALASLRSPKP